jgi:phosphate transport system ATP-binding protein
MKENTVTALIGPSGCGKSTSAFIEQNERPIDGTKMTGSVIIDGVDIYGKIRMLMRCVKRRDGFFKTKPISKTIYENVAYGLRVNGLPIKMKLKSALLLLNKWRFGMRLKTN